MHVKLYVQCECRKSILTFSNKSTSSVIAFFPYPGGGNGKQRDIAQNPNTPSVKFF